MCAKSSTTNAYQWDPDDRSERSAGRSRSGNAEKRIRRPLPPIRYRIVAYDYGIKDNILRQLRQTGFGVTVVPGHDHAPKKFSRLIPMEFFFPTARAIRKRCLMRMNPFAD